MLSIAGQRDGTEAEFVGQGDVRLLGIAAQSLAYIRFFHDFGIQLTLATLEGATIRKPHGSTEQRQPVTIVSEGPFVMKDPMWYENVKKQAASLVIAPSETPPNL